MGGNEILKPVGGVIPYSALEWKGGGCMVVFFRGCNFRCPWCHNPALLSFAVDQDEQLGLAHDLDLIWGELGRVNEWVDGVVLSGGEPTLWGDLCAKVALKIREEFPGLKVLLDTNGSRPDVLKALLRDQLVDGIRMDVKADPANPGEFSWVCGGIDGELVRNVRNSIDLLASWDWEGEVVFRTTVLPGYNYAYLRRILSYLEKRGVSPTQFYLNPFRFTGVRISRSWLDDCHRRWGSSVVATEAQVREWEQALQKGESAFSGASHPEEYSKRVG